MSQSDWTGRLEVNDIDVYQIWILGRTKACEVLNIETSNFNPAAGCSMIRPKKRLVGVSVDNERQESLENTNETSEETSEETYEASTRCTDDVSTKVMRKHVGVHIIKSDLGLVCGFCGLEGCSIDLVRGSGRGKTATMIPGSNCEYVCKFDLKSAEKSTKSGPCTNRPVVCSICSTIHWSYNLPIHFCLKHSDHPIPARASDKEKKFMGIEN